jgi:two-component system cell cycle sensor histidine kinase/response regulator CckA
VKVLSSGVSETDDQPIDLNAAPPRRLNPIYAGTETILLVDDEPMMRKLLKMALEAYGYTVLPAIDGESAIDVASAHAAPVHLVLSDVVMPRLDGRQLMMELRRWFPTIGVLLMSGLPEGQLAALSAPDELTFFIQKPFSMDALGAAVRSAIEWRPNHTPG